MLPNAPPLRPHNCTTSHTASHYSHHYIRFFYWYHALTKLTTPPPVLHRLHLKHEIPACSAAFQLKRPTYMPNSEWWKADDTTRANARDKHPPMESLPYCTQYNGTADNSTFPQKRLKCWDTVGRVPVWAVYVCVCVMCVCVRVRA